MSSLPIQVYGEPDFTANDSTRKPSLSSGTQGGMANGAYNSNYPIVIPSGSKGVEPAISLSYSSERSNSVIGVGWALSGLPAIVEMTHLNGVVDGPRDALNYCQDEIADGTDPTGGGPAVACPEPEYAYSAGGLWGGSGLGNRLILKAGTSDRYITRNQSSLIFHNNNNVWSMRDGHGNKWTFRDMTTIRYKTYWLVSKVEDYHGNHYWIDWADAGRDGGKLPIAIYYTGHANDANCYSGISGQGTITTNCRKIRFHYPDDITRTDITPLPNRHATLLQGVEVYGDKVSMLYKFVLTHRYSKKSGRLLLISIKRCEPTYDYASGTGGACSATTKYEYSDYNVSDLPFHESTGTTHIKALPSPISGANFADSLVEPLYPEDKDTYRSHEVSLFMTHAGDVNADGFDDIIRVYQGANGRRVVQYLGSIHGLQAGTLIEQSFTNLIETISTVTDPSERVTNPWHSFVGDMNRDGFDDLILPHVGFNFWRVDYVLGTPSGLETSAGAMVIRSGPQENRQTTAFPNNRYTICREHVNYVTVLAGDINGDGALDIVATVPENHPASRCNYLWSTNYPADGDRAWVHWAFGGQPTTGFTNIQPTSALNCGTSLCTANLHDPNTGTPLPIYRLAYDVPYYNCQPPAVIVSGQPTNDCDYDAHNAYTRGVFLTDINRDGRDDFVAVYSERKESRPSQNDPEKGSVSVRYALGSPYWDGFKGIHASGVFNNQELDTYSQHFAHVSKDSMGQATIELLYQGYTGALAGNFWYDYSRDWITLKDVPSGSRGFNFSRSKEQAAIPYPVIDNVYGRSNLARWESHFADFTGDGVPELVTVYAGIGDTDGDGTKDEDGLQIVYYKNGLGGGKTKIAHADYCRAGCIVNEQKSWRDGGPYRYKHHSGVADLNGDGLMDLVLYYYGAQVEMHYALGHAGTVLGQFKTFSQRTAESTQGRDKDSQALFPDVNGDGLDDIVIVNNFIRNYNANPDSITSPNQSSIMVVASVKTDNVTKRIDIMYKETNFLGGDTFVSYKSAAEHGAIHNAQNCNGISCKGNCVTENSTPVLHRPDVLPFYVWSEACGVPNTAARELVTQIKRNGNRTGSFPETSTRYLYKNARFRKGAHHGSGQAPPSDIVAEFSDERANLGFSNIITTDENTLAKSRTTNLQVAPYVGRMLANQSYEHFAVGGGSTDYRTTAITEYDWIDMPGYDPDKRPWVRLAKSDASFLHSDGKPIRHLATDAFSIDIYGNPTETRTCAKRCFNNGACPTDSLEQCYVRAADFPVLSNPDVWLIHRPREVRQYKAKSSGSWEILDAYKYSYGSNTGTELDVQQVDRLLDENNATIICSGVNGGSIDESCATELNRPNGIRWVAIQKSTLYDRFGFGTLISVDNALNSTTSFVPEDDWYTYVKEITNDLGHRSTFTYNLAGRAKTVTDPNSVSTTLYYDEHYRYHKNEPGWVTPNHNTEQFTYEDFGKPGTQRLRQFAYSSAGTNVGEVNTLFDGFGQPYQTEDSFGIGSVDTTNATQYVSESDGTKTVRRRVGDPHKRGANYKTTEWVSDNVGRLLKTQRINWDGLMTYPNNKHTYTYNFNHDNFSVAVEDALGNTSESFVDEWDRLIKTADALSHSTTYQYDPAGRVTQVVIPASTAQTQRGTGTITYKHDSWGRMIQHEDWATGTTRYAYDDVGNLVKFTDNTSSDIHYCYDSLNRLTKIFTDNFSSCAGTSPEVTYTYDIYPLREPSDHPIGRLCRIDDSSGSTELFYNKQGLPYRIDYTVSGRTVKYDYSYDWLGRMSQKSVQGRTLDYMYNGQLLHKISDAGTSTDYVVNGQWNALKKVGRKDFADGTHTEFGYDDEYRLATLTTSRGTTVLQDYSYSYDDNGLLRSITDQRTSTLIGGVETNDDQIFTYDALGRLKSASNSFGENLSYKYDSRGNFVERGTVDPCARRMKYTYHNNHDISANIDSNCDRNYDFKVFQINKDNRGNRTNMYRYMPGGPGGGSAGVTDRDSYLYDAFNRLTLHRHRDYSRNATDKITAYTYNALDNRVEKRFTDIFDRKNTVTSRYFGDAFEERENSFSPGTYAVTEHIMEPGFGIVATITSGPPIHKQPTQQDVDRSTIPSLLPLTGTTEYGVLPGTLYYHPNHLGSSSLITDAAGTERSRLRYQPFGALRKANSVGYNLATHKFSGQEVDEESGLHYMGARYYDDVTGRFLTADTVTPTDGISAQGFNRYAYVMNNPAMLGDASGYDPVLKTIVDAAGAEGEADDVSTYDFVKGTFWWVRRGTSLAGREPPPFLFEPVYRTAMQDINWGRVFKDPRTFSSSVIDESALKELYAHPPSAKTPFGSTRVLADRAANIAVTRASMLASVGEFLGVPFIAGEQVVKAYINTGTAVADSYAMKTRGAQVLAKMHDQRAFARKILQLAHDPWVDHNPGDIHVYWDPILGTPPPTPPEIDQTTTSPTTTTVGPPLHCIGQFCSPDYDEARALYDDSLSGNDNGGNTDCVIGITVGTYSGPFADCNSFGDPAGTGGTSNTAPGGGSSGGDGDPTRIKCSWNSQSCR